MADADSRTGHRYATAEILAWVDQLHAGHDAGLQRAFDAPSSHGLPPIQVGMSEGRLLTLLLRLGAARKVVEFGTLAGYSALRMAQALPKEGHLWSLELDPTHASIAQENLASAGVADQVTVLVGPALDALPRLEMHAPFDAVFLDADKGRYDLYGRWAGDHLRPGGLLLVDNAYFFGDLLAESEDAAAVRRCHQEAARVFDTVCIPTPDGLLLGIKR